MNSTRFVCSVHEDAAFPGPSARSVCAVANRAIPEPPFRLVRDLNPRFTSPFARFPNKTETARPSFTPDPQSWTIQTA
jgi:hypothetical protein